MTSELADGSAAPPALAASVPASVRYVCETLTKAGFVAVAVGGAVRDALLGKQPGDWDIATSALPNDVVAIFPKTIPTGIAHGTVTVLAGRGDARMSVEVTTFRGEGAYSDARRPDHVVFGVPLREDLARRDFVINAIAYDPAIDRLYDPFNGRADLDAKLLRAVGDPVARFTEDGLRVMRAIRFAAQLGFALEPTTEAAIEKALPSLARVSAERVHDELRKLLAASQPELGLRIGLHTGVIALILKEVTDAIAAGFDSEQSLLSRVSKAPAYVRVPALLASLTEVASFPDKNAAAIADRILKRLKFANAEREHAVALIANARGDEAVANSPSKEIAVRQALSRVGRARGFDLVDLWNAMQSSELAAIGKSILDRGDALVPADLAVSGGELMKELGVSPGPAIGRAIAELMRIVLEDPTRNQREILLAASREWFVANSM